MMIMIFDIGGTQNVNMERYFFMSVAFRHRRRCVQMVCAVHHLSGLERLLLGFFLCLFLLLLLGITLFFIFFFLFGLLLLLFLLLLLLFGWLGFGNVRIQIHGFANSLVPVV